MRHTAHALQPRPSVASQPPPPPLICHTDPLISPPHPLISLPSSYGLKTGKPRRELGIISYKKKLLGPTEIVMVMPRVRKDGACAQFRPSQPEESMIQLYKAGRCA